jgi:hypothetical protein
MDFLFVIALILLIYWMTPKPGEVGGVEKAAEPVVKEKSCPPHAWRISPLTNDLECSKCNQSPGSIR